WDCWLLPSRALHLGREQQAAATDQCDELTPRRVGHGLHPEPAVPAYRRVRMPRKCPQVLGTDLNCSESGRPLILKSFYSAPDCKKCSFLHFSTQGCR